MVREAKRISLKLLLPWYTKNPVITDKVCSETPELPEVFQRFNRLTELGSTSGKLI
jgi:hypothetical protein